jgi:hypothetical protein
MHGRIFGADLPERIVRYTLWSRGRLIGHTALDFYPFHTSRMGWLELTELGERFAESLETLDFELRNAIGIVIPTVHVSVQDTDRLARLAENASDDDAIVDADPDETTFDDEFAAALIELGMAEPPVWEEPEEEGVESIDEPDLPRFQVYVELVRADSVPIADRWKDDPDVQEMLNAMRTSDGTSA